MGWLRKIVDLTRTAPDLSDNSREFVLLKNLFKGVKQQIKIICEQQKYLAKRQNKFRQKFDEANEDDCRKLAKYDEENKNLEMHLDILGKKLNLIESGLLALASENAGPAGSSIKSER